MKKPNPPDAFAPDAPFGVFALLDPDAPDDPEFLTGENRGERRGGEESRLKPQKALNTRKEGN